MYTFLLYRVFVNYRYKRWRQILQLKIRKKNAINMCPEMQQIKPELSCTQTFLFITNNPYVSTETPNFTDTLVWRNYISLIILKSVSPNYLKTTLFMYFVWWIRISFCRYTRNQPKVYLKNIRVWVTHRSETPLFHQFWWKFEVTVSKL